MLRLLSAKQWIGFLIAAAIVLGASPMIVRAGMPAPLPEDITTILELRGEPRTTVLRLREEPRQRLQVISFFLLALLVSSLCVKWLWNGLRREFPRLPRMNFGKAVLLTVAWGLLFCIVLVMISGARELMTPGAWKKEGPTYQLNHNPPGTKADQP